MVVVDKNQKKVNDDEFQHDGMVVVDKNQQKVHDDEDQYADDGIVVVDRNQQKVHDGEDQDDYDDDVDLPVVGRIEGTQVEEVVDNCQKVLEVSVPHFVHDDDDDERD